MSIFCCICGNRTGIYETMCSAHYREYYKKEAWECGEEYPVYNKEREERKVQYIDAWNLPY